MRQSTVRHGTLNESRRHGPPSLAKLYNKGGTKGARCFPSSRLRLKSLALIAVGIVLDLAPRVENHGLAVGRGECRPVGKPAVIGVSFADAVAESVTYLLRKLACFRSA